MPIIEFLNQGKLVEYLMQSIVFSDFFLKQLVTRAYIDASVLRKEISMSDELLK